MRNISKIWQVLGLGCTLLFSAISAKSPEDFLSGTPRATTPGAKPKTIKPLATKSEIRLDTTQIHAIYLDGEFDKAIKTLETHLQLKRPMSHGDSLFAFKHLGVMYAATVPTREKGRYYLNQLIFMEPTAKILDMYASDMIFLIFRNAQEEYERKRGFLQKPVATPESVATPAPVVPVAPVAKASSSRSQKMVWITGGLVVAAGTAGLIYILMDSPEPKVHTLEIPQ